MTRIGELDTFAMYSKPPKDRKVKTTPKIMNIHEYPIFLFAIYISEKFGGFYTTTVRKIPAFSGPVSGHSSSSSTTTGPAGLATAAVAWEHGVADRYKCTVVNEWLYTHA